MNIFITPHPPIILREIGRGEEKRAQATIDGMKKIAEDIAAIKPETIAVITPHGPAFRDALCISTQENLKGDFGQFSKPGLSYEFAGSEKAAQLCSFLNDGGINAVALDRNNAKKYGISEKIDHGALVPLSFILKEYTDFKLIHISMGFLSKEQLGKAGAILSGILEEDDVLIVSGDLSHRLSDEAHYGYNPQGAVYDKCIVDSIANKKYLDILEISDSMLNSAGQCAQRPLEMMIGVLDGYETQTQVYSYEGPYGVGYMTAHIVRQEKGGHGVFAEFSKRQIIKMDNLRKKEDAYVSLARKTIETYIKTGNIIKVPENLSEEMYKEKNGVFVSIKKEGDLRGCIGTIEPSYGFIAEEIINNAVSAATRDPRFDPIEESELKSLVISVDILFPPEDIKSMDELDPKEYGVIVQKGFRRGLLLPNLEGVDTAQQQVSIALRKAGISSNENYTMQRFKVVRHK